MPTSRPNIPIAQWESLTVLICTYVRVYSEAPGCSRDVIHLTEVSEEEEAVVKVKSRREAHHIL